MPTFSSSFGLLLAARSCLGGPLVSQFCADATGVGARQKARGKRQKARTTRRRGDAATRRQIDLYCFIFNFITEPCCIELLNSCLSPFPFFPCPIQCFSSPRSEERRVGKVFVSCVWIRLA